MTFHCVENSRRSFLPPLPTRARVRYEVAIVSDRLKSGLRSVYVWCYAGLRLWCHLSAESGVASGLTGAC